LTAIPFRQWLKWLPAVGWSPTEFWSSSLTEFFSAIEGWNRMNGGGDPDGFTDEDRREVERLKRVYL